MLPNRTITEVTKDSPDFASTGVRGRSVVTLSMRKEPGERASPDILQLNERNLHSPKEKHFAYDITNGTEFSVKNLQSKGLRYSNSIFGTVTDINGDGRMELVLLNQLQIFQLWSDFRYRDVSKKVLPVKDARIKDYFATWSVAELDYDNDGRWDLFVARSTTGHFTWYNRGLKYEDIPVVDYLLRNMEGKKYEDVTEVAGIPTFDNQTSHSVTAGDFDNDGFVDIFIVRYTADPPYVMLRNLGNGSFEEVACGFNRSAEIDGDGVVAVDYDRDGRLDLVVSEGNWGNVSRGGNYRIMKNMWETGNNYLLVRVMNAPGLTVTSLHATVTVTFADGGSLMRRVGSPGVTVSVSYIELVHFGLGKEEECETVTVRWIDGTTITEQNVAANSTIEVGV